MIEPAAEKAISHQCYMRPVLFVSDIQRLSAATLARSVSKKKWHEADGKGKVSQVDRGGCEVILSEDAVCLER